MAGPGQAAPAWRFDSADQGMYPKRSLITQYQEIDLAFVARVIEEEGSFYFFEHAGDPTAPACGSTRSSSPTWIRRRHLRVAHGAHFKSGGILGHDEICKAEDFTKLVTRSPKEQIKTLVVDIKYVNTALKTHLKNLDLVATARAYNRLGYKNYNFEVKLEGAYKKFKGEK